MLVLCDMVEAFEENWADLNDSWEDRWLSSLY
jgi:hypothetical protein